MDLKQTKAAVEAMLFAHAEPVTAERLAGVLGVEEDAVSRLLLSLRDDYEAEDRGLVLLIDSRYTRAEYRCLMPPHWSHMRYVSAPKQAQELVQAFWSETNKEETAL